MSLAIMNVIFVGVVVDRKEVTKVITTKNCSHTFDFNACSFCPDCGKKVNKNTVVILDKYEDIYRDDFEMNKFGIFSFNGRSLEDCRSVLFGIVLGKSYENSDSTLCLDPDKISNTFWEVDEKLRKYTEVKGSTQLISSVLWC